MDRPSVRDAAGAEERIRSPRSLSPALVTDAPPQEIQTEDDSVRPHRVRFTIGEDEIVQANPVPMEMQTDPDTNSQDHIFQRMRREPTIRNLDQEFLDNRGDIEFSRGRNPSYQDLESGNERFRDSRNQDGYKPRGQHGLLLDSAGQIFGYNVHELIKDVHEAGRLGLYAKHVDDIGEIKMRYLVDIITSKYKEEFHRPPPEVTHRGHQEIAKRCQKEKSNIPPIGGFGTYYTKSGSEEPEADIAIKMDKEMQLTFTRNEDGRPYYGTRTGHYVMDDARGPRLCVTGHEKSMSLMMESIADVCGDSNIPDSHKFKVMEHVLSGANRDRILEESRNMDEKLDAEVNHQTNIPSPLLLYNGDKAGNLNDKTLRDASQRFNGMKFSGTGGDIKCRDYLTRLSTYLAGRYHQDAAFQIWQSTMKGKPLQFLIDSIEMDPCFHYVWGAFCKNFLKKENPEEAVQKLLYLRQDRPIDMTDRIMKIQGLANVAAFEAPTASRPKRRVEICRAELKSTLIKWFPNSVRAIMLADNRRAVSWLNERTSVRIRDKNPDEFSHRNNYHPWFSFQIMVLDMLTDIQPEERPRGHFNRRVITHNDKGKPKRKADIFAIDEYDFPSHDTPYRSSGDLTEDYAESIISEYRDFQNSFEDDEVCSEWERDVIPRNLSYWEDHDNEDSDVGEDCEAELDALHAKPGDVMRRFQTKPGAGHPGHQREPRRDDKDRRREGRRDGGRREGDVRRRISSKFPYAGKNDAYKLCHNCGSPNHNWEWCGTYEGAKPGSEKQRCCGYYHTGSCKVKEARELDARKKARLQERAQQSRPRKE